MRTELTGGVMTLEKSISVLDKILEYSLYGLAFFIPISIAFVEILTTTAIGVFLLKKILSIKLSSRTKICGAPFFTPANGFLLLFFIFCGLSLVNSAPYFAKGLNALFIKWAKFMMLSGVAAVSLGTERRLKNIALVFLTSAALIAIDACFQKFLGLEFLLHRPMTEVHFAGHTEFAVTGALKHSNNLAAYLIYVIPLLAGMAAAHGRSSGTQKTLAQTLYQFSLVVVILLLVFCLVLTFSRGGWLGFIVAGGLMFFLLPQKKFILFLGTVFVLLILSSSGITERVATSLCAGGDSGRYQLWDGAWAMIAEHPFLGKGVGTFMAFSKDYIQGRGAMYAHNCYLQIWAETGIFGLLSFLMFLGVVFRSGLAAFRQNGGGEKATVLAGLLCGTVAFLIQSALDTNLYSLQPSAMFWLSLGMIQALSSPRGTECGA